VRWLRKDRPFVRDWLARARKRRRIILASVSAGVLSVMIVSLAMLRAAPSDDPPTLIPTPLPSASGQAWQLSGPIGSMSGEFWSISGTAVRVTDSTAVQSDVPISVGTLVVADGTISADGTRLARHVVAGTTVTKLNLTASNPSSEPGFPSASQSQRVPAFDNRVVHLPLVLNPVIPPAPRAAFQSALADLNGLRPAMSSVPSHGRFDEAIQHLNNALVPSLWADARHLRRSAGGKVFDETRETINQLGEMLNDQRTADSLLVLRGFVDRVRDGDRGLASVAIDDALHDASRQAAVAKANAELALGDAAVATGHSDAAIDYFHNAWQAVAAGP
jgi:hypothetical protein